MSACARTPRRGARSSASFDRLRRRITGALEGFVQGVLDNPVNGLDWSNEAETRELAEMLWRETLILAFRVLFLLELERRATADEAGPRGMAQGAPEVPSPGARCATAAARPPGGASASLEMKLRSAIASFDALDESASEVAPLGRSLFDPAKTRGLDALAWGETAVSTLLEGLREPVAAAPQPPERLGRLLEGLLGLEPCITSQPSRRVRHPRVEVIVPEHEACRFEARGDHRGVRLGERLPAGRFALCAGLGRKTEGAFYTPPAIVGFLTRRTLLPLLRGLSPADDPRPDRIIAVRVLDPAMGSGYFLLEACRVLGDALYRACQACLELADHATGPRAARLRARVAALPELGDALVPALHQNETRARALCRRAIATRCLFGVDRSALAVELARLALWLETWVDGWPPPSLDHNLVAGDALLAPLREDLERLPASGAALDAASAEALEVVLTRAARSLTELERARERLPRAGHDAARRVRELERARRAALRPLLDVTSAWTGAAVVEGAPGERDGAFRSVLARAARGPAASSDAPPGSERRLLDAGREGVPLDLLLPPRGDGSRGFDAVLGNPPWDKALPLEREFFAERSLEVLAVPTARERAPLYAALRERPGVREAWSRYAATFRATRAMVEASYRWQVVAVDGARRAKTGGHGDSYRYFTERSWRALRPGGRLGLVLPNTFYGAQSATGVRRLLLTESTLELCLGFTNARKIFDIGRGQRFCLVVAAKTGRTRTFRARFGLEDDSVLTDERWREDLVTMRLETLERLSGGYLGFLETSSPAELELLEKLHEGPSRTMGAALAEAGIDLYQEMNMTVDSRRFTRTSDALASVGAPRDGDPRREPIRRRLLEEGWLVVHEKGTFHAWNDGLKGQPRYCCHRSALQGDPRGRRALDAAAHPRLAVRATIHATERDKSVFCLLPPGVVVGNSALTERTPNSRSLRDALLLLAVGNSRAVNYVARRRLGTNLNKFLLEALPAPRLDARAARLAREGALRLSVNHQAFAATWERLTETPWSRDVAPRAERGPRLRAALEALVADAFGLDDAQWATVLDSTVEGGAGSPFGRLCLEALQTLRAGGLEGLVARHAPMLAGDLVPGS